MQAECATKIGDVYKIHLLNCPQKAEEKSYGFFVCYFTFFDKEKRAVITSILIR
jgi:hypothetical protein